MVKEQRGRLSELSRGRQEIVGDYKVWLWLSIQIYPWGKFIIPGVLQCSLSQDISIQLRPVTFNTWLKFKLKENSFLGWISCIRTRFIVKFGINKHLEIFQRRFMACTLLVSLKNLLALYLFTLNCTGYHVITYTNSLRLELTSSCFYLILRETWRIQGIDKVFCKATKVFWWYCLVS